MNLKYKELSIVGKIWSLAELFSAGIRDNKKTYLVSSFKKIVELRDDKNVSSSETIKQDTMKNIMEHVTNILHKTKFKDFFVEFNDDKSVVSIVWQCKIKLDEIKIRIKNDSLTEEDVLALNDIYHKIKSLWLTDLKEKKLHHTERRDLFEIKEEIKSLKEHIEKRVERNQITII